MDCPDRGRFRYRRTIDISEPIQGKRFFLHFGAIDFSARVWLNGRELGGHRGGYSSFSFEITDSVHIGGNELLVEVRDSLDPRQPRGKQSFLPFPFLVWYSGYAGIWQPVWLETTGRARIASLRIRTDWDGGTLSFEAECDGLSGGSALRVLIRRPRGAALEREFEAGSPGRFSLRLGLDDLGGELWSPEAPNLYRTTYTLESGGEISDTVDSYFGLRRVEARGGRVFLNGNPLYLRMVLVQGYYPEGGYTPIDAAAMKADILAIKDLGYNGARIHEKIESPAFGYLCDAMGLVTTIEMPSFYLPSARGFSDWFSEARAIAARDSLHPSAIAWVLFNETWGIWGVYRKDSPTRAFVESAVAEMRRLDPERLIIDNSGWEHLDTDIVDFHHYLGTAERSSAAYSELRDCVPEAMYGDSLWKVFRFYLPNAIAKYTRSMFLSESAMDAAAEAGKPWLVSEYGGFGWYKTQGGGSVEDEIDKYTRAIGEAGLFSGYCYTQLYDVGSETNGLFDASRRLKVDAGRMRLINALEPSKRWAIPRRG